jgi:hypothetical protein
MAAINEQITRHANRCRLVLDGETIAEGLNLAVQEQGGTQGIYTVGSEYPHEHVHNQYSVNVQIGALWWKENGLSKLSVGGGELVQLPPVDVEAYDESDGATLWVVRTCTLVSRSVTVNANQPLQRNVQLMGIWVDDLGGSGGSGGVGNAI